MALADSSGTVIERFRYDAQGAAKVMDVTFATRTLSSYDWQCLYTGRREDLKTGLYFFRARYYHPQLGRFISRDPLGFVDGMSLYRSYFVPGMVDASGNNCNCANCQDHEEEYLGEGKSGFDQWFCPKLGVCYETGTRIIKDNTGKKIGQERVCDTIKCPRAVCPSDDGFDLLSPGEDNFHGFLVEVCEQSSSGPCLATCLIMFKGNGTAIKKCVDACKKAMNFATGDACKLVACLGVAGKLPGADCLKHFYGPNGFRKSGLVGCRNCCENQFAAGLLTKTQKDMCVTYCERHVDTIDKK